MKGAAAFPDPLHVFCGLSVNKAQARELLGPGAAIHPPIKRGDIPAVVAGAPRPGTIAVIDGVFHSHETLTLLEIRDAIQRGWSLVGCSSMGALRALEAEPLGMRGYGTVYRWLRLFRVEDDDEVAQTMSPDAFEALSLAMVDVRWHISRLRRSGLLEAAQAREVLAAVKSRHYPDRTRRLVSRLVAQHSGAPFEFPAGLDAPKRRDALALLRRLGRREAGAAA